MAHFAQVDGGIVRQVIVVDNNDCAGGEFPASESAGQAFLAGIPLPGTWMQTSYSGAFRGKYAGQGDLYDDVADEFTSPPVPEPIPEP